MSPAPLPATGPDEPHSASSRPRLVPVMLLMLAAIAGFYLLREHWDHLAGRWAYLLLLACPLIHLFGHGGHGNSTDHRH